MEGSKRFYTFSGNVGTSSAFTGVQCRINEKYCHDVRWQEVDPRGWAIFSGFNYRAFTHIAERGNLLNLMNGTHWG